VRHVRGRCRFGLCTGTAEATHGACVQFAGGCFVHPYMIVPFPDVQGDETERIVELTVD
jgi:hypothetical protein